MSNGKSIKVKSRTYFDLEDLKEEMFNTDTASFDAVVSQLIEEHEENK